MNPEDHYNEWIKKLSDIEKKYMKHFQVQDASIPQEQPKEKAKVFCCDCEWFREVSVTDPYGKEIKETRCLVPNNVYLSHSAIRINGIRTKKDPDSLNVCNDCPFYSEAKYIEVHDEIDLANLFYTPVD